MPAPVPFYALRRRIQALPCIALYRSGLGSRSFARHFQGSSTAAPQRTAYSIGNT